MKFQPHGEFFMYQDQRTNNAPAPPQSESAADKFVTRIPSPADSFISKTEVARRLGKTARTIEHWMKRGVIPYLKLGKGRRATVLFKWADIEAHLKSHFGVTIHDDQQP
jgi:excisionase family DNA binding protein